MRCGDPPAALGPPLVRRCPRSGVGRVAPPRAPLARARARRTSREVDVRGPGSTVGSSRSSSVEVCAAEPFRAALGRESDAAAQVLRVTLGSGAVRGAPRATRARGPRPATRTRRRRPASPDARAARPSTVAGASTGGPCRGRGRARRRDAARDQDPREARAVRGRGARAGRRRRRRPLRRRGASACKRCSAPIRTPSPSRRGSAPGRTVGRATTRPCASPAGSPRRNARRAVRRAVAGVPRGAA